MKAEQKINLKTAIALSAILIALGLFGRLLPHAWNMTPTAAVVLFASAYLGIRYSAAVFLITMFVADIFLGFYNWKIMLSVYLSFGLIALIGLLIKRNRTALKILGGALLSSVIFFIVSNLAVWQWSGMYSHTLAGLSECFTLAIPFFKNTLAGDLLYSGLLFGVFESVFHLSARKNLAVESSLQNS